MARPKSNGPYAPLSATYYRDDLILAAGEQAELLFVRCLAFLADSASDGYITDRQMRLVVGMGMRNVPARCARLVELGLLTCIPEVELMSPSGAPHAYLVRSWGKWNKTADEIGKHLKRDRERKQREVGTNSARNPDGFQPDSSPQITTNQIKSNQITTRTTELDNEFERAWMHWPKKVSRLDARKEFTGAVKRLPAGELVEAIIRFGDAYTDAGTPKNFVPGLGLWLKKGRWDEDLPVANQPEARKPTRGDANLEFVRNLARQQQLQQMEIER